MLLRAQGGRPWFHIDQHPLAKPGFESAQGSIALTATSATSGTDVFMRLYAATRQTVLTGRACTGPVLVPHSVTKVSEVSMKALFLSAQFPSDFFQVASSEHDRSCVFPVG